MKIDLKNNEHSYAIELGVLLKKPLFTLTSNLIIALNVWNIAKVIFHCMLGIVFIAPATASWCVGKTMTYFSKPQIDHDNLSLAPPPVKIPEETEADESIDITELSKKYDQMHLTSNDFLFTGESLLKLCNTVLDKEELPAKEALFRQQLVVLLRNLTMKIKNGEVSKDKEIEILTELAEASEKCPPTWLEVATKLYYEVNGQAETAKVKLLRMVQHYKEAIILEFSQNEANSEWHALNYVRNILGDELGLNTEINQYDSFAANEEDGAFGKNITRWIFMQRYDDVNRLILAVESKINSQDYDVSYYDHLVNVVKEQGVQSPDDYVTEQCYTEDYKLNRVGASLLLKSIGIIR